MNAFETERLIFRTFEPEDLEPLARINADPVTSRYVGDGQPLTLALTRLWIENSRENVRRHGYGTGAVVLKASGERIGWGGGARPEEGGEEILYGFDRAYWGKGFGTELLAGLLGWTQGTLGLGEVRATVHRDNAASIAMLERAGFALADECYDGDPETLLYISLPVG